MGIENYIKDLKLCIEKTKQHEKWELYNSYCGELRGAQEICRLIKCGYSIPKGEL